VSSDGRPTLLIVDDEPGNVRVLTEVLRDVGNLRIATSGDRALALGASDDPPDLILLDVEMPGLDGWETCRRLKADPRTAPIPVIFITGLQDERDEVRGFEAGAVDYVTKPFRPVVVRARLEAESRLDALTGIANRRRFGEALASAWDLSSREGGTLALVLADIDHFKAFNDRFGHPEGDVCLRRVSGALSGATRRKSDLLARWGG
jgi:PleD family two-component response regulator